MKGKVTAGKVFFWLWVAFGVFLLARGTFIVFSPIYLLVLYILKGAFDEPVTIKVTTFKDGTQKVERID